MPFVLVARQQVVPLLLSKGCLPVSPAKEATAEISHIEIAESLSTAVRAGYASAFGAVRQPHHFATAGFQPNEEDIFTNGTTALLHHVQHLPHPGVLSRGCKDSSR